MTTDRIPHARPGRRLPSLWGEGGLFAFSGVDGPTCAASGVVATLGARRWSLLLHTPVRRLLDFGGPAMESLWPDVVTGDVLLAEGLSVTWPAWDTVAGELPEGAKPTLTAEGGRLVVATTPSPGQTRQVSTDQDGVLVLRTKGRRFALSYGPDEATAARRAEEGLACDLSTLIAQRLAWFDRVPAVGPVGDTIDAADAARLAAKLASVMKVNTLGPEGPFGTRWSTPDRVPHRDLWLWDSAFHSFGMNHLDAELAWEFLSATLDTQLDDGLIPHQTGPTGWHSDITQPPVLAWAVWENHLTTGNTDRVRRALPQLLDYLKWDRDHRDRNGNGLLEWAPTGQHAGCESGLDNSPRFDRGPVDAVDFNVFYVHDLRYVARLAERVGDDRIGAEATRMAAAAAALLHEHLWNDELGTYADRDAATGAFSPTRAVSDFFPLLLDDLPAGRARRLLAWLDDPARFASADPIPSVSLADPAWGTDMWRGASWINTNYFVALGLRRHGFAERAAKLEADTLRIVADGVDRFGVTFEFYDAAGQTAPIDLDRKGPRRRPYDLRNKMDSIRDYHWTAALSLDLLLRREAP
ncbi:MAG: trehalase family glycosidase [Planctomycetota bacterium]